MGLNKSDYFIYNILNYEDKNVVFLYGVLLIIFIFIFTSINVSTSLFIGLIFYTILIYYFYTDRNLNNIYEAEKIKEKFEILDPINDQLKKYPDIVDLLFYVEDIKVYNIPEFNDIVSLFEEFSKLYDSCMIDYNLIDSQFENMVYIKTKILYKFNSFNFNIPGKQNSDNINNVKKNTSDLLNKLLNNLILTHKKKIYYNGYNRDSSILNTTNVLPYNIIADYSPYTKLHTQIPNMSDLLVY
jgi:hypothetical protein